jgi:dipeptidyl aminopeptidase/acylaminoacyl peptidase
MVNARVLCVLTVLCIFGANVSAASISSSMIAEMREITSVSISPDGSRVVAGICHPNTQTNRRELSWIIIPLRGGKPIILPAGDEIFDPKAPGALLNRQAQWSSDGKWFFYLRRRGAEVQLWRTSSNGASTRQVTNSKSDLIDLAASANSNELLVQLAPDRDVLRKAEEAENRSGVLYDDHVIGGFPLTETLPIIDRWRNVRRSSSGERLPPGWGGTSNAVFDVRRHKLLTRLGTPTNASTAAESASVDYRVTTVALGQIPTNDPSDYAGQYTLQLESKTAARPNMKCTIAECIANQITILGWSPSATEIYYMAESLSGRLGTRLPGRAAIYAWDPTKNVVRLVHEAGGRLYNLDATTGFTLVPTPVVGPELVVAFTGADQPPLLEAINLASGVSRVLFDPNTELRALTQGRATWQTWPTSSAYPGRGIIVLPDDYQPGHRYPAVITTYTCGHGFLRGGGNDNAPEFVAAHHGFLAICVDFTVREIIARENDYSRIYPIMCQTLTDLIADQANKGVLDPARVGISGQSAGANAGAYCISRSNAFAAAAFRHGSAIERVRWDLFDTAADRRDPVNGVYARFNLPDPRNDPTGKWDAMSVVRKARDINAATLIQVDDTEYLTTLPIWSAMHEEGKAVEMHVFPKETHVLMQPIHRLVNYERQLDWFRFWLKHEEDSDPSKSDQYARWHRLSNAPQTTSPPPQ